MRENCTYGSMRGRAFPTGRPALLYTLGVPPADCASNAGCGIIRTDDFKGGFVPRPISRPNAALLFDIG